MTDQPFAHPEPHADRLRAPPRRGRAVARGPHDGRAGCRCRRHVHRLPPLARRRRRAAQAAFHSRRSLARGARGHRRPRRRPGARRPRLDGGHERRDPAPRGAYRPRRHRGHARPAADRPPDASGHLRPRAGEPGSSRPGRAAPRAARPPAPRRLGRARPRPLRGPRPRPAGRGGRRRGARGIPALRLRPIPPSRSCSTRSLRPRTSTSRSPRGSRPNTGRSSARRRRCSTRTSGP